MKKLIGLLTVAIVSFTSGALAFNSDEVIAKITSLNFTVNGQQKTVDTQILSVDGTTYLPLRAVASMLGFSVNYDNDTRTVGFSSGNMAENNKSNNPIITTNPSPPHQQTTNQQVLTANSSKVEETKFNGMTAINVNGNTYFKARDYSFLLESMSQDNGSPENTIKFDIQNKSLVIVYKGSETKIDYSGFPNDDGYIYKGETYLNSKYYLGQ